jgi:hypothetical protein
VDKDVLIDDREVPGELRHDLDAFLKEQPEVQRLGAFIPRMEASAFGVVVATTTGIFTTVCLLVPKSIRDIPGEIVKELVMKWAKKKFNLTENEAKETVILYDQFDRPCVRVELNTIPKSKR